MAPQAKLDTRTRDRAIPEEERRRKGAFYTPTLWVDEAHKMVSEVLGPNWRDECVVWDCAAGTANLARDYTFRDLILSTIDQADIDSIGEEGINPGAWIFGYDFLNDDSSPFFSGKNVIPSDVDAMLKAAARDGKRLVFFINPPYGTANNAGTEDGNHKAGIALTAINTEMKKAKIGASSQQLYAQFMFRCAKLAEEYGFAQSTVAAFTKPTFMSSGSYKGFRDFWYARHAYQGGMLFQASHFADVSGRWGISFTVWSEGKTDSTVTLPITLKDVADYTVVPAGNKAVYNSDGRSASRWVREPVKGLKGVDAPQFSSGLKVKEGPGCRGTLVPGSLGYFGSSANNLADSDTMVYLVSGTSSRSHGCSVLPGESFRRCTALYAARKLVTGTWVNDKDEYLAPKDTTDAYKQWNDDAIVYALLHNANNCTAMRDVQHGQEPVGDAKCVVTTGIKAVYTSDGRDASSWVPKGPRGTGDSPKFSSGLSVRESYVAGQGAGSLGVFCNMGNNLVDSAQGVMLLCGKPTHKGRCHVDMMPGESFRRCMALYAARKLVAGTWVNDKDEYLTPTDTGSDAYKQWNDDCVVYALLHNANNCTAMRDVPYKGKTWRIKNNFWWKTREQSKELYDRPDTQALYADVRGETEDSYLATILPSLNLSPEARECLRILDTLLVETLPHRESFDTSRPELHLMAHDAGLYQLKTLFREVAPMAWKTLQIAFKALGDKLRPGVFDHGFLLR